MSSIFNLLGGIADSGKGKENFVLTFIQLFDDTKDIFYCNPSKLHATKNILDHTIVLYEEENVLL